MLHQRRFSQRASLSHSLNLYSNQNFQLFNGTQQPSLRNSFAAQESKLSKRSNRKGLGQIQNNNNKRKDNNEQASNSKIGHCVSKECHEVVSNSKQQTHLFDRISQLIKNQEKGVPSCHSTHAKKLSLKKQRPYTSLSNRNKLSQDFSILGKYHVVLDLTPKQQIPQTQDPSKVSTSRALMNFSKVYRNSSGDRFKVKRDRHSNQMSLISTQKVVLLEKEKVSRKELEKLPEQLPAPWKKRRESRLSLQKKLPSKGRYFEDQQFQIDGWEYFD